MLRSVASRVRSLTRRSWRLAAVAGLIICSAGVVQAQVDVTATGGTLNASYTTLKGAFDAVNNGTHTGAISIAISANTTETATAVLNSGAVLPASYTAVSIAPTGGPRIIEGSIAGAVVKLNGADNVTIDGRISGTGRNLTIRNTSTAGTTAAIWLASVAAGNGCTGNTIRNCEIACGALQNTGTNTTWGILMCGTTISNTANGVDNDNNTFQENRIIRCRHGIVTRGTTTDLNNNIQVLNNIIGPNGFGADQIGLTGIYMQSDNNSVVTGNTVQFVGGDFSNTTGGADRVGIALGSNSWSSTSTTTLLSANYTVSRNLIHDIVDERTFSALGILIATINGGSATNNLVCSNMIYNIKSNGTAGDQCVGIGTSGGNTDQIVYNSIRMTGEVRPNTSATATSNYGSGIRISSATNNINPTIKNNAVYIDLTAAASSTVRYYCITGTTSAYAWGTGSENYNDYFYNTGNAQCLTGGLATASGVAAGTQFTTLGNWQTAYTIPQDANSLQVDPGFASATDLHIATSNALNAVGSPHGCTVDFDGAARDGSTPDIGADEFAPFACFPPQGTAAVQQDCVNNQFYINVTLTNLNGAPSVDIGSNYSGNPGAQVGVTTPGTYQIGPFLSNSNVSVQLLHNGDHTCDATLSGTYTYDCSTFGQNALSFDGVDDRVNCGDTPSLLSVTSQVTLEAWIYPTAWRTNSFEGSIINKEAPSTQGYMIRCGNNGQLSFNFGTGSAWVEVQSATGVLTLNTWQHVAATYDGATLRIFVNGVQVGSLASTVSINPGATYQLTIGNWSQSNTRGFIGKIDEARVWNIALAQSTIVAMQNQAYCGNETGLLAYYRFDQGIDGGNNAGVTTLTDLTPNANTGTLVGFALNGSTSNWVLGKTGMAACVPVTCFQPSGLNISGLSATSATLNWTSNGSASYDWEIRTSGLPGSGPTGLVASNNTTGSSATYSSLTANTSYSAYVRSSCTSPTATSTWAQVNFSTPCAVLTLPVLEGFNAATIPGCWSQQYITGTSNIQYVASGTNPTTTPNEGSNMVYWNSFSITNNNETRLVSVALNTTGASSVDVEFDWREENNTSYSAGQYLLEGVTLQYSLNGTTWTDVQFYPRHNGALSAATWMHKVKTVPAAGNQGLVYFGFKFHSGFGDNCYMDKVEFKQTPGCIPPTATATYVPDCANGQFSVTVNVTGVGSGGFVNIVNNGSAPAYNNVGIGTYSVGPFPIASSVNVTVQHGTDPLCNQLFGPFTGTGTLCNDNCTGAYPINCASGTITGTNTGATADGTPSQCSGGEATVDNGVWYKFTGNNTTVTLSTCDAGTNFDTRLHVYSGTCGTLVGVAGNDDAGAACSVSTTRSIVTFNAFAGTDYYIAVEGYGTGNGTFKLSISCAALCTPVVGNEDCATAQPITLSTPGTCDNQINGNTDCASSSTTGNPTACFGTFATLPDAFYSFVAPTGTTEIAMGYNAPDVLGFALYSGTCGSLTYLDCKVAGAGSWLYSTLSAGSTYYIRVLSNQGSDQGAFTLCVRQFQVPPQDVCPGVDLATLTSPYTSNTTGSTDGGSLSCVTNTAPDHIYYIDVPDQNTLRIGDLTSSYTSAHELRTGASCPGSTTVICSSTDLQQESYVNTSGTTQRAWWIQDGDGSAAGSYQLQWQLLNCIEPTGSGVTEIINCNTTPQFYVDVNLTSLGNAASVNIVSDQAIGDQMGLTTTGTYQVGPFAAGSTAVVTIVHNGNNTCNKALGSFTVPAAPLCNDACTGAIPVSCGNAYSGTNVGATADGVPSQAAGGEATVDNGVWYSFTASATGEQVTVSTCAGTSFDTRIHVFQGTCGSLIGVAGGDDVCGTQTSVTWNALPNTTYYIAVEGYGTASGTFSLAVSCGPLCNPLVLNDLCVNSQTISMTANCIPFGGNLSCATNSAGANPSCTPGTFAVYNDAFYTFQATAPSAFVTLTNGGTAPLYFVIYNGSSCNIDATNQLYCSAAITSGVPVLVTGLTTNNFYQVRVMQLATGAGPFTMCVQKLDVSDDPCTAPNLTCGDLRFGRTTGYLNNIPSDACPFNGAASTSGVNYFTYTAPADQDVTFSTCGQTAFNTRVSVFDGACTALTCNVMNDDAPGCPGNSSEVTVRAYAGQTYTVMVTGSGATDGNYQLSVFCQPWCSLNEANDRCANSITVPTYITGTGVPSTENQACSYADAPTSCSGAAMVQGVWYDFNTGPNTVFDVYIGVNSTDPQYSAPAMSMALFNGACSGTGASSEVLCQANCNGTLQLPTLTANTTYRMLVYNAGGNSEGTFGLQITHPGYNDAGISTIVQPTGVVCDAKLFPQVYLHNYGENPLTSAQIISSIDNVVVQTYAWSGPAIPRGDSALVSLPVITSLLGVHSYSVTVGTVNGVADELALNDAMVSTYDASGQTVKVQVKTDANGAQTSWSIFDAFFFPLASAPQGSLGNNTVETTDVCLPTIFGNCFYFFVFDQAGDGIATGGGWQLSDVLDRVVLQDNGAFLGQSPALSPATAGYFAHEFCLPLGPSSVLQGECNVFNNLLNNKVFTSTVAGVTNYQFEFSDPNAGFRRRIAVPRNWVKFSEMQTSPLAFGTTYFCRVRVDQGSTGFSDDFFGAGCEMALNPVQPICTELISTPGSTLSCGVTKAFGGSDKIYAQPVTGATQYRFNFSNTSLGYSRNILRPTYVCLLSWVTQPLVSGNTYDVKVEALVSNVWSGFCGATCQVTIFNPAFNGGGGRSAQVDQQQLSGEMQLWPNPVVNDQVNVRIDGLAIEDQQVSVDLYDIFGKRVMAENMDNSGAVFARTIELPTGIARGVYTMNITINGNSFTKRVTVQ